jgi:hypothetical protein
MSVSHLDRCNLAAFAAAAVQHNLAELAEVLGLLSTVAAANAAALAEQYGDTIEPATAVEIGTAALEILAGRADAGGWPPLAYNCVTNAGRDFLPADVADRLRFIEQEAGRIREREERQHARAEANAVAYDDVPRLETVNAERLREAMAAEGADRVIVATFRVDETDTQTDYFGSRSVRHVVIGLGRGRRESFAQLRKAAARFAPTRDYGPGLGRWFASVVLAADCYGNGCTLWKDSRSPWHDEHAAGPLPTRAAAEAHAAGITLTPGNVGGTVIPFAWRISEEPIEHRENYSMGAGNYLGCSRYGGWTVSSTTYPPDSVELFSLAAFGTRSAKA